ncbi:MAG TPA: dihydroorotate dehydrogenase electron transfer subunit [Vicinamibacterales bacterium]|nr:dihydroorotate dehydrogenase electron transfer subunit [Vicinamibacterales bacterium]
MPLDVAAEVLSNTRLSPDYNVIGLAAPEIAAAAAPGQFLMLKTGDRLEPLLRRPFSVFEILKQDGRIKGLSVLNKRIGPSTRLLFDARPGDRVQCLGPLGRPFVPVSPPDEAWLVAGGVGLAPFATLAETLRARGTHVRLYYGARSGAELFFLEEFTRLGVELHLATEDGSRGERGRVTVPLERDLGQVRMKADTTSDGAGVMVYACGPEPMLAAVAKLAAAHGRQSQVSVERVMGCGLGGCYSCVIPIRTAGGRPHYVRSCIAGPTFRGDEIEWQ